MAALAIAAVTASSYGWGVGIAKGDAKAQLREQAGRVAASVVADLATVTTTATSLAAQPGIEAALEPRPASQSCSLSSQGTVDFPVVRVDLVRGDGAIGCSSQVSLVDLSKRPHAASSWLAGARRSAHEVFLDAFDAPAGGAALVATARIGSAARPLGVVAVVAPLAQVGARLTAQYAGLGRESFTIVDAKTGAVVTSSERGSEGPRAAWPATGQARGLDGQQRLYASVPVKGTPWRLYAGRRTSLVVAEAHAVLLRQSGVGLVVLLALLVVVLVLDRRLVRPLRTLRSAVVHARRSPDRQQVTARGTSELVGLAGEFNAMQDVRSANEAQLKHMISHDALTGLPNRVGLRAVLEEHLAGGHAAAVVSLGIDRFRILNESLGHDVADGILREIATRLSQALAPQDVLARFRGDEFIAFCPGVAANEAAVEVARVMEAQLRAPVLGDGFDVAVTATAGVAVTGASTLSAAQLLRHADLAMHQAKRSGLDVATYDPEQGSRAREHLAVERALRVAMERGELLLHYQPIFDIASGRVVGSEALVRWDHPERGLLPPGAFLPVAERTGQIVELGGIALHLACRQMATWGAREVPMPVSVNVAVEQLRGGDFPALVETELADCGIDASFLCLELTESSFLQNITSDLDQLAALRRMGVHLAIDDFGTGYSSLAYVHDLPLDRLKIDISFVRRVAHDARARHLVAAIIGMAQALSLDVIAEGVEGKDQLEVLADLGCDHAQGYLLGRPMGPDDLVNLLRSKLRVPEARQSV